MGTSDRSLVCPYVIAGLIGTGVCTELIAMMRKKSKSKKAISVRAEGGVVLFFLMAIAPDSKTLPLVVR